MRTFKWVGDKKTQWNSEICLFKSTAKNEETGKFSYKEKYTNILCNITSLITVNVGQSAHRWRCDEERVYVGLTVQILELNIQCNHGYDLISIDVF